LMPRRPLVALPPKRPSATAAGFFRFVPIQNQYTESAAESGFLFSSRGGGGVLSRHVRSRGMPGQGGGQRGVHPPTPAPPEGGESAPAWRRRKGGLATRRESPFAGAYNVRGPRRASQSDARGRV
jgi:hypothetical protein